MDKRSQLITDASRVFETGGFRGTGVDALLAASGTSTRTLYKHFGSRDNLVAAVLQARDAEFMDRIQTLPKGGHPVGHLFDVLEVWLGDHARHGCMLIRAQGEYAEANPAIAVLATERKAAFRALVGVRVEAALGRPDERLRDQVWLLFEGAVAAAGTADLAIVSTARDAACALVAAAT